MANALLSDAVHANPLASGRGLLERLFTLAFSGLVYPQIWEDPRVDMVWDATLDMRVCPTCAGLHQIGRAHV